MQYIKHSNHLTLIPFGLRKTDEQLVDVSSVKKGKDCGCVCPSCHAALIARKGDINQWHFAHAFRGLEEGKIEQCDYSFYLSVALMAKQLLLKCDPIRLPDYIYTHSAYSNWSHQAYKRSITLTKGRRITPEHWLASHKLEGITLDLVCEIAGFKLGVMLQRPDKQVSINAVSFEGKRIGVVQIDLLETLRIFRNIKPKHKTGGFQRALRHFLLERIDNKQWLYYPHQENRISAVQLELSSQIEKDEAEIKANRAKVTRHKPKEARFHHDTSIEVVTPNAPTMSRPMHKPKTDPGNPMHYECVLCEETWTGTDKGLNPCPKCHSHLYRRALDD